MKITSKLALIFVSSLLFLAAVSPALALTVPAMDPRMHLTDVNNQNYSTNWSGYSVTAASGSTFSSVSGSWTVTSLTGTGTAYSAFWVGLDGYTSSTVEQTGTLSISSTTYTHHGSTTTYTYYAWYEFYPASMYQITTATSTSNGQSVTATVTPGDSISASVTYTGNNVFSITITDSTKSWTFTTTGTVSNAALSSAEWIAEAPSSSTGVLPLADFGTVSFTSCYATLTGGTPQPISYFGSNIQSIEMATETYNHRTHNYVIQAEATPSLLGSDGTSFSVIWNSA